MLNQAPSYKVQSTKSGQAVLVAVIFFTSISLLLIANGVNTVSVEARHLRDLNASTVSFYVSEAGLEEATLRIKKGWADVASVPVGSETALISVASVGGNKEIISASNVLGANRKSKSVLIQGVGSDFSYGAQIGTGGLRMESNTTVIGNVYTNGNIMTAGGGTGSRITGSAYAVGTISDPPQVDGGRYPGSSAKPLPPLDLGYWRAQAESGGVLTGNQTYSGAVNLLGPKKIVGDVTFANNAKIQIAGPIYITGNLTLNNNSETSIHSSLGSSGTTILVDGRIIFKGAKTFSTGTTPEGYLLFATSRDDNNDIDIKSSSGINANIRSVVYATNGQVELGNAVVTALIGRYIDMENSAEVEFDSGLLDSVFSGGSSGGWNISSWREI